MKETYAKNLREEKELYYTSWPDSVKFSYQMGSPWEIVRNDVSYPVKFYGEVISGPDGKKEWVGGEKI